MRVFGIVGGAADIRAGLTARLVDEIAGRGISVSVIRRADGAFDVDHPGKDSHRHRSAGAREVLLASRNRLALMQELRGDPAPHLDDLVARLDPVDLVLADGFATADHGRIEVHGPSGRGGPAVRAVTGAADSPVGAPDLDLGDAAAIADFILREVGL